MIEFPSAVEWFVGLRLMVCVGLLHQRLIDKQQIGPSSLLPLVLPIVLWCEVRPGRMLCQFAGSRESRTLPDRFNCRGRPKYYDNARDCRGPASRRGPDRGRA